MTLLKEKERKRMRNTDKQSGRYIMALFDYVYYRIVECSQTTSTNKNFDPEIFSTVSSLARLRLHLKFNSIKQCL